MRMVSSASASWKKISLGGKGQLRNMKAGGRKLFPPPYRRRTLEKRMTHFNLEGLGSLGAKK